MNISSEHAPALRQYLIDMTIDNMRIKFTLGRIMHEELKSQSTLTIFQRYESNIERSLFKLLHELQRLQAARNGGPVSIPAALDLNIS